MTSFHPLVSFTPVLLALIGCYPSSPTNRPLHEAETSAAWSAFDKGKFEEAIKHAENCIQEFRGTANRLQKELVEKKLLLPIGSVTAKQKDIIHRNGVLNDVATCYFIKARAAYKLGRKQEMESSLQGAIRYPAARTWDNRGWFWAPSVAADIFRTYPQLADKPPFEVQTFLAWEAYNRGAYRTAIKIAEGNIVAWRPLALQMQADLAKRKVQLPTGAVTETTRSLIFAHGHLNEVATCLFIKGRAAEARGDNTSAVAAYREVLRFRLGRCWDEKGWFWSPAEAAGDRLEMLGE